MFIKIKKMEFKYQDQVKLKCGDIEMEIIPTYENTEPIGISMDYIAILDNGTLEGHTDIGQIEFIKDKVLTWPLWKFKDYICINIIKSIQK